MQLKGAIFDLDGTLLDSMFIWATIGAEYLRSQGVLPPENLNDKFRQLSLYQAACYLRQEFGLPLSVQEIMDGVNRMTERLYFEEVKPKADIMDFLELLRTRGVKMCVATATDRYLAEAALERNHMAHYFSGIFTCTQVGKGKDEPEIFEQALLHLQTQREETVVFEDSFYAARTAHSAGFRVAAIYDDFEKEQAALKELADYYFLKYAELEKQLF